MIIVALYSLARPEDKGATGGNISNVSLIRELSRIDNVKVIVPNLSAGLSDEFRSLGVTVITEQVGNGRLARFLKRAWLERHISLSIREAGANSVVIASNGTSDISFRAISRIRSGARPRFYLLARAFEDLHFSRLNESRKSLIRGAIAHLITRGDVVRAYRDADVVIANSNFMANAVSAYFGLSADRVSVLYPPIDPGPEAWRGSAHTPPRVGFVNPSPRKGVGLFLTIAERLPDVDFLYFGPQDKQFPNKNIVYAGWARNPKEIYSRIDLLIVPSQWHEPFGRVAVEATFHGVPALVSNRGGLPETVTPRLVLGTDSADDWAREIARLLSSESQAEALWRDSLSAAKRFSSHAHSCRVREIFARTSPRQLGSDNAAAAQSVLGS